MCHLKISRDLVQLSFKCQQIRETLLKKEKRKICLGLLNILSKEETFGFTNIYSNFHFLLAYSNENCSELFGMTSEEVENFRSASNLENKEANSPPLMPRRETISASSIRSS